MSAQTSSDFGLYWLTAITTLLLLLFLLKTKWWRTALRVTIVVLVLGLCATGWYITARRNDWIHVRFAEYSSSIIFCVTASSLTVLFIILLRYNWKTWAWSKTDD